MRNLVLISAATLSVACGSTPLPPPPAPDIHTQEISYEQGGVPLKGLLAWNERGIGKRPGVLVVHEWWGHDEHARNQARRLAEAGYVAFALDMYGETKHATHPEDAQKFMAEVTKDPTVVVARFNAARDLLMKNPHVDKDKIAAIGYCFGGNVVLNLARGGADVDLDAVVSFHGVLEPMAPATPGAVKARVLVLTGENDEFVPLAAVEKFRADMTAAGANFRIVTYPGAKHSFTNPKAEDHGMPQLGYNADADRKSWQEMLDLFKQVFGA